MFSHTFILFKETLKKKLHFKNKTTC